MLAASTELHAPRIIAIATKRLKASPFSLSIYGDPDAQLGDLLPSIRETGVLVPLVVARSSVPGTWEVISGHRRLACVRLLGLRQVTCEVRSIPAGTARQEAILEYNRQRPKSFSQLMREADALEKLWSTSATARRLANLKRPSRPRGINAPTVECRNSDARDQPDDITHSSVTRLDPCQAVEPSSGRTDIAIARALGIGGKDLFRQARAVWQQAQSGDARAQNNVKLLDMGTKTIHCAYKDLRRRHRYSADFRPTPYDVWSFRHDRAFGIPHPGSIPPAIVAHTLHYFCPPGGTVVDPMAGGGTTFDVAQSMGRICRAYDLNPVRPEIQRHDIRDGFPNEALDCDLIFCDPPYHTMLAHQYADNSIASAPFPEWIAFLHQFGRHAFLALRPGGRLALLLAPQTEKDIPRGTGYLDHAFLGYVAATRAGFQPERRISCPMDGAYLPQHVQRARAENRLLGQVRDLLIMRKPSHNEDSADPVLSLLDDPAIANSQY